jgi:hypothetical protein
VLRKISRRKRDNGTGEWRRMGNKELCDLYSSQNIICIMKSRRLRWVGHATHICMGVKRSAYRVLVGKLEGKRPVGRRNHRWEADIKMDLQEVGGGQGLD